MKMRALFVLTVAASLAFSGLSFAADPTVGPCTATDAGGAKDQASPIGVPALCTEDLARNDADWFSLDLKRGQRLEVVVTPITPGFTSSIELAEPSSIARSGCEDRASVDRCEIRVDRSGTWLIGVTSDGGIGGSFSLAVAATDPQNDCGSGADAAEGAILEAGAPALVDTTPIALNLVKDGDGEKEGVRVKECSGIFDTDDSTDAYAVDMLVGSTLAVGAPSGALGPTVMDPMGETRTLDTTGAIVADIAGPWSLSFTPTAYGKSAGAAQQPYSFKVTATAPFDCAIRDLADAADSPSAPTSLTDQTNYSCGGTLDGLPNGSAAPTDTQDWYRVVRPTSGTLIISLDSTPGQCLRLTVDTTEKTTCDGGEPAEYSDSTGSSHAVGVVNVAPPLSLETTTLDFVTQRLGTRSLPRTIRIRNSGASTLTLEEPLQVRGVNPSDFTVTSACGTIAAGGACTAFVSFTPGTLGPRSADLVVKTTNSSLPARHVGLLGDGEFNPLLVSSPFLAFESTRFGVKRELTVTLKNIDPSRTLTVGKPVIGGMHAPDFAIEADCGNTVLPPGRSCSVKASFRPQGNGDRAADLVLPSDAGGDPTILALTGRGIVAEPTPPAEVSFLDTTVGQTRSAPIKVRNLGDDPMIISGIAIGGANAPDFRVSDSSCVGRSVSPGSDCDLQASFVPTDPSLRNGTVIITGNFAGSRIVALKGTGLPSGASIAVAPESIDFGPQTLGSETVPRSITIRNTGGAELRVTSIATRGGNADDFLEKSDTCSGAAVPANGSCTAQYAFKPRANGTRISTIVVKSNGASDDQLIPVSGRGVAASGILGVTPVDVDFGSQRAGTTSTVRSVRLSNTGSAQLTIASLGIDPNNGAFKIRNQEAATSCRSGQQLPARTGGCNAELTFTPTVAGTQCASLIVDSDAPGSPHAVRLCGQGSAPSLVVASSVDFDDQSQGGLGASRTLTLSNAGDAPLRVGTLAITGEDPRFKIVADGCSGTTVGRGGTCRSTMVFAPIARGPQSATLEIPSDASAAPRTVALLGRGLVPPSRLDGTGGHYVLTVVGAKIETPPTDCLASIKPDAGDTPATAAELTPEGPPLVAVCAPAEPDETLSTPARTTGFIGPVAGKPVDQADFFKIKNVRVGAIVSTETLGATGRGTLVCLSDSIGGIIDPTFDEAGTLTSCGTQHRFSLAELADVADSRIGAALIRVTAAEPSVYRFRASITEPNDCGSQRDAPNDLGEAITDPGTPKLALTTQCVNDKPSELSQALDNVDVFAFESGSGKSNAGIAVTVVPANTSAGTGSDFEVVIHRPDLLVTSTGLNGGAGQPEVATGTCATASECGSGTWYIEIRRARGALGNYSVIIGGTPA